MLIRLEDMIAIIEWLMEEEIRLNPDHADDLKKWRMKQLKEMEQKLKTMKESNYERTDTR
jgi:hypothetical protein